MKTFIFLAGAVIGATTAQFCLEKRYKQITQEEIDSIKTVYTVKKEPTSHDTVNEATREEKQSKTVEMKPDLINYATKLHKEGYINYTEHSEKKIEEKKEEGDMSDIPYIISPDDFDNGNDIDHTMISLVYYNGDKVLADEQNEVIEDIADTVGEDFAEHFGEYEDDSVFVRNERLKCDYEIQKDNRSYSDVVNESVYW